MLCWECLTVADDRAKGWRAYRVDVPGEDPEPIIVFYCRGCAEREFGGPFAAQREVAQLVRTLRTAAEAATDGVNPSQSSGRRYFRRFNR
jgi:hypothetical protein